MKKAAITAEQWNGITPAAFERLALKHVEDVYPDVTWVPTRLVHDEGKDAVGTREVATGVAEIYWMEAKHKPKNLAIGKYTLDTHLVSVVSSGRVKRLHVVTSGKLTPNFLHRATEFASSHSFTFSYSDARTLQGWLRNRPDCVRSFGRARGAVVKALSTLAEADSPIPDVICTSFILPEDDAPSGAISAVTEVLPGRKYTLLIAFSPTRYQETMDVVIRWRPDPIVVGLLRRDLNEAGIQIEDVTATPVVAIPFRLLRYANAPFVAPVVVIDGEERPIVFRQPRVLARLISPFAGQHPMEILATHTRTFVDVNEGRPRLIAISGRAGSGKSRLAEELRDEAQHRAFVVKMVRFERGTDNHRDVWRSLFRWIFGLEDNLFSFKESDLLERALTHPTRRGATSPLNQALSEFLMRGTFVEELFNRDVPVGQLMTDALVERLRLLSPVLLHIDDAHHLSPRLMAPLYLLRHIVESRESLPLCVLVTSRNDETVIERAIDHFNSSVIMGRSEKAVVEELRDLDNRDAEMLVADTLQWPELRTTESAVAKRILERAGTNPFSLLQVMTHIAVDKRAVAFGRGEQNLLVDVPAFKAALTTMPKGIENVLQERFDGLSRLEGGDHLIDILTLAALLGRQSEISMINTASSKPVASEDVRRLLSAGYLSSASNRQLVLSHDLLSEGLLRASGAESTARRLSQAIEEQSLQQSLGDDRLISIYFKAGSPYAQETWGAAVRIMQTSYETEDYRRIVNILPTIETLRETTPSPVASTYQFRAAIAGVHQHCGNTFTALTQFVSLMNDARQRLGVHPTASQEFADSACEAGNQSYLRLELSQGFKYLRNALDVLSDDVYEFDQGLRGATIALAHNRMAAILQIAGRSEEAEAKYRLSMEYATAADDRYLVCHCLTDIGVTLRQRSPSEALSFIRRSRDYWREHMPNKERRRIMIDCSEQYSLCLQRNDYSTRSRFLAIATEAAEKGYVFQAADAILCLSYCAIAAGELAEGADAALKALNLSALSEDLKSRMHAYHYLTVTAAAVDAINDARDYQAEADRLSADPMFDASPIRKAIDDTGRALSSGHAVRLVPHPFSIV